MSYREPALSLRTVAEQEAVALAALLRAMVAADGRFDDDDRQVLANVTMECSDAEVL